MIIVYTACVLNYAHKIAVFNFFRLIVLVLTRVRLCMRVRRVRWLGSVTVGTLDL